MLPKELFCSHETFKNISFWTSESIFVLFVPAANGFQPAQWGRSAGEQTHLFVLKS